MAEHSLTEQHTAALRALLERVQTGRLEMNTMLSRIGRLHTEAVGVETLLTGPAQDVRAMLSDALSPAGDCGGLLREVEIALSKLLEAPELADQVARLGWTWGGWVDGQGWRAWRAHPGDPSQRLAVEVVRRSGAELLHELRAVNAAERAPGKGCGYCAGLLEACPACHDVPPSQEVSRG